MKYCPYCGAALIGGAASFCVECGEPLPSAAAHTEPATERPNRPSMGRRQRTPAKKHLEPVPAEKPDPLDEGYDGYYDDVLPIDDGQARGRRDSQLIKRAVIVGVGALLIVVMSVIVMSVL